MKTKSGQNQKWIVRPGHRDAMRALFLKVFDAALSTPMDGLDLFKLSDGLSVGVFYEDDALDEAQARKGAWLEFAVDDAAAGAALLEKLGVARVAYSDTTHAYFQAPGGPVFRVAGAAGAAGGGAS